MRIRGRYTTQSTGLHFARVVKSTQQKKASHVNRKKYVAAKVCRRKVRGWYYSHSSPTLIPHFSGQMANIGFTCSAEVFGHAPLFEKGFYCRRVAVECECPSTYNSRKFIGDVIWVYGYKVNNWFFHSDWILGMPKILLGEEQRKSELVTDEMMWTITKATWRISGTWLPTAARTTSQDIPARLVPAFIGTHEFHVDFRQ